MNRNKKILITGSSKGIGKSVALNFLSMGYEVIGVARTHSIKNKKYIPFYQDMSNLTAFSKTIDEINKKYPNIFAVISNAGAGLFGNLENLSETKIINYYNLNLLSHIILAKKMIANLKRSKNGIFIFIGSEASKIGGPQGSIYSSAKHGLFGFVKSFKLEANKSSVRVTIINPGMVKTSFFNNLKFKPGTHKQNTINPKDIAEIISFLCASNKNINYSDINIDPIKKVIVRK